MITVRIECGSPCAASIPRQFQTLRWYKAMIGCARAVCQAWIPMDISVVFVERKKMREINRTYHGQDRVTDVLSFAYPADAIGKGAEGELYLCPEQIVSQARRYGSVRSSEYARVIVHGVLHLQGYDHMTTPDRRRMNHLSKQILSALTEI